MGTIQGKQKSHSLSLKTLRTDDNEDVSSPSSKLPTPNITKNLAYIDHKFYGQHPKIYNTSENDSEIVSYPTSKQPPLSKIKPSFARQFVETSHNTQSKTLQETIHEDYILQENNKRHNHHFGRLMSYRMITSCRVEVNSPKDTYHSQNSQLKQDNFSLPSSQSDIGEFFVSMTNIVQKQQIETIIRPRSWTKGILKQRSDQQERQSKHVIGKVKHHVRFQEVVPKQGGSRLRAISDINSKSKPKSSKKDKKQMNRREDKHKLLSIWVQ